MTFRNLSHTIYTITTKINILLGRINYFSARWWGVQVGRNCNFIGKCNFKRFPGTQIIIGDKCSFLSKKNSNLIGINRPCSISTLASPYRAKIIVGTRCGFSGTVIGAYKHIEIGNNVRCGANTLITDSDWHLDDPRSGEPRAIVIGNNVWLGVNSVVLKGVTIGDNTVIGANSVVTKSLPANVIAAGNPCKVIRPINI